METAFPFIDRWKLCIVRQAALHYVPETALRSKFEPLGMWNQLLNILRHKTRPPDLCGWFPDTVENALEELSRNSNSPTLAP